MSLDLFDLLKIDDDDDEKKKPAVKKEATKAKKKTAAVTKYGLPMTINADGIQHTINADEMGQQEVTKEQILEAVEKRWPWYPHDIIDLEIDEIMKEVFVTYKQMGTPKGKIAFKEGDRFMFRDNEIDYSELINDGEDNIEVAKLQDAFKALYPDYFAEKAREWTQIAILRSDKSGVFVPILPVQSVTSVPVQDNLVFITAKCNIAVTKDELLAVLADKADEEACIEEEENAGEEENADEEESVESVDKNTALLDLGDIEKVLKEKGLVFNGRLLLSKAGMEGSYSTWTRCKNPKAPVAHEELYPVDGVRLSLYYARYELSTKDFDGKEEVTKDELLAYLVRKGHPEYEHTEVRVSYIKKEKLILVSTSGSKKGAIVLEYSRYQPYIRNFREPGVTPRYEQVENPLFSAAITENTDHPFFFSLNLPRIPEYIREQGEQIGKYAYNHRGSEVSMDLYYSMKGKKYFWNPPVQRAMPGSVSTVTEEFMEASDLSGLIKVGQGHSHGGYPAFFSGQDDYDERIPGIYFVWGSFHEASPSFCLRVSCGRNYQLIGPELIFETDTKEQKTDVSQMCDLVELVCERFKSSFEEPNYMCFGLFGREVLFIDYINPYLRNIYEMCKLIRVYDLYTENHINKVSSMAHTDPDGYIISTEEIVPSKGTRCLEEFHYLGCRKTLMKYTIDNFDVILKGG